jgi:glycosyltransferase involved in cell wall biosynthesis
MKKIKTNKQTNKKISILTPCLNEVDNVVELSERIRLTVAKIPYDYEHIFIDNCSTDGTIDKLRILAANDKKIKVILNTRNFGAVTSPYYGVLQSFADACIMIPSDLQDPPEIILEFVKKWEEGYKIALAVRQSNKASKWGYVRKLYYRILNRVSEVELINDATGAGIYDEQVIKLLRSLNDPYPYFRGLLCEIGFPIAKVPYTQQKRKLGNTKHDFFSLLNEGLLGVVKQSKLPVRLFTIIGGVSSAISFVIAISYFIAKLLFWNTFILGVAPLIIGFFFMMGIQMLGLGLIGEYALVNLSHARKMPLVVESERINF